MSRRFLATRFGLALLLDELAVERCAMLGLDFGGFLAAEMAIANQLWISSLVLVNATGAQSNELKFQPSSFRPTLTT